MSFPWLLLSENMKKYIHCGPHTPCYFTMEVSVWIFADRCMRPAIHESILFGISTYLLLHVCVILVVINFISDRQYKNKDKFLTKQSNLSLIVWGHQRSPWAHRAGRPCPLKWYVFLFHWIHNSVFSNGGKTYCKIPMFWCLNNGNFKTCFHEPGPLFTKRRHLVGRGIPL